MGGGAAYLARAELRRRWAAVLAVALVFGFAAGAAMSVWAAARRGPEALARFDEAFGNADGSVFLFDPTALESVLADAGTAGAERAAAASFVTLLAAEPGGGVRPLGGTLRVAGDPDIERPAVVRGRLPDPAEPYEMALNEAAARTLGLEPGDTIDLGILSAAQTDTLDGSQSPAHGDETFTLTGVFRQPSDLVFQNDAQPGTLYENEGAAATWSPALWARYDGDLANYGVGVIVQAPDGEDVAPVVEAMAAPYEGEAIAETEQENEEELSQVRQSVSQQSNGLRAFAAVVAVTAAVLVVQALRRQEASGVLAPRPLLALGADRSTRTRAALAWAAPVAAGAAATAVVLAYWLSSLGPVGVARLAELEPGRRVDLTVFVVGAVATAAGVLVAAAVPLRTSPSQHRLRRPSAVAAAVPWVTASNGVVVARELARGRGRTSMVALPVAFVAVVASVVFGASVDHATTDPEAFGWTWDYTVGNCSTTECQEDASEALEVNDTVRAWSGVNTGAAHIDGSDDDVHLNVVLAGEGWAAGRILEGRPPASADEVVLAPATARDGGVGVGDRVPISVEGGEPAEFVVSGIFQPPSLLLDDQPLDRGAAASLEGALRAVPPELAELFEAEVVANYFLVDLAEGVDEAAALARLRADFPGTVLDPVRPVRLEAAYRLRSLPSLLAALVGLLGIGALLHLATVGVGQRRSTLATFGVLGCTPRQRRGAVAVGLLVVVAVALAVALPLGVVAGRVGWSTAADGLGTSAPAVVPALGLVAVVVVSVATTAVLGTVAGRLATRHRLAADFGVTT